MEIDRRRFLAWMAVAGGSLAGTPALSAASGTTTATGLKGDAAQRAASGGHRMPDEEHRLYVAARKNAGRYEAALFDAQGRDQRVLPLPGRGHSFAIDAARGRVVAFGRQPGFFAIAFDAAGKRAPQTLDVAPGRHFFGHGVFSPDGRLMAATENDYEAGRGVLGLYDASQGGGYRRVGEVPTHGVGPHEVVLMPDGRTLCVANGGILTHPDYGKLQLNADDMRPSLAYIDMHGGQLLEQVFLDAGLNRLSIRHLVVDGAGSVWFGCQHTGPAGERPPLVGRHRRGGSPELFTGPDDALRGMKNYVGSLARNASGTRIATSSPVGGQIMYWDAASGRCLGVTRMFDGCGVAPLADKGFLASSGQGELARLTPGKPEPARVAAAADLAWDNHLRQL
ncbi:DUF1513 domain-containing protein [Pollutimonas sp. M17]|uniref:DUF1513 domain-containing protein n=1 Tax=Pollutimonas sp. M17 TaxID=2962065 RepID=UPI0021F4673F|nr:DUF1513 domain-containing protein [Pollutimonas sp. M17]UYO95541.1 DUF1513 domain-containing protein [Pollutimonas sp. M17]